MSAEDDLMAVLAAQLDEDERLAQAVTASDWGDGDQASHLEWEDLPDTAFAHAKQHHPTRVQHEVNARRAVLAEHLPIESGYGLTCKRCVSWLDDEGQHEFGIAIPEPWPCLPVASIAASNKQNLALAVKVLTAGRAVTEAEFLARLPDRAQAIADQLSTLLPDGLRFAWSPE